MTVWVVLHEYQEDLDEYATWKSEIFCICETEELAARIVTIRPYKEKDHFSYSSREIETVMPELDRILLHQPFNSY